MKRGAVYIRVSHLKDDGVSPETQIEKAQLQAKMGTAHLRGIRPKSRGKSYPQYLIPEGRTSPFWGQMVGTYDLPIYT